MKISFKKLSSCSGASMIIALLFMLVCVFVGGSILVAATVNAYRIDNDRTTQQSILDQRSACSVFSKLLTKTTVDSNGKVKSDVDISLPYILDGSAKKPSNPYDSSSQALKYVICEVAGESIKNNNETKSLDFTIEDTDGKTLNCVAVCKENYTVYIQFKDNPQVQLRLQGRDTNNTITWYSIKIIKAE